MDPAIRFVCRYTPELTGQEINDTLSVLNSAFPGWGDKSVFDWKYSQNPYGNSLHVIVYDGQEPIASVSFWRNDVGDQPAYQCVDVCVVPGHQRRGIFRRTAAHGAELLDGAYLYTFPNWQSRSGFLRQGWTIKRKVPITVHTTPGAIKNYQDTSEIPQDFAGWRFGHHPQKKYYVCRLDGRFFLLTKRRENCYAVGGVLAGNLGLEEVKPRFLLSYDFPNRLLTVPRHTGCMLENIAHRNHPEFIGGYRPDGW